MLDRWQELAVKTAVELVTEQYIHPRIYLLEGAPGTGKTHTIANMIPAMLKVHISTWHTHLLQHNQPIESFILILFFVLSLC